MRFKFLLFIPALLLFTECKKSQQKNSCGTQVCTALFATIGVAYVDKNSAPIAVSNFSEINLRTNKTMTHQYPPAVDYVQGYYIIADDSDLKNLSAAGDTLKVMATNPGTGQTLTTLFLVSGGDCACHVNKISGPSQVKFD